MVQLNGKLSLLALLFTPVVFLLRHVKMLTEKKRPIIKKTDMTRGKNTGKSLCSNEFHYGRALVVDIGNSNATS